MNLTATYSPDDNKLRLYSTGRLDPDTYNRVRKGGFIYAPKQELFVAPAWTPEREDLLLELAGEIGDEDTSLLDRAEARADRFEGFAENRGRDAEAARHQVESLSSAIPLGQPILVGHHSERHARRDAERIENGMRRAVKMWETSAYWSRRADGAIHHAKYLEKPAVRARRIKTLEAEHRKQARYRAEAERFLGLWTAEGLTLERARAIADRCWLYVIEENGHRWTAYDVLQPADPTYAVRPAWTVDQVVGKARKVYPRIIANCDRWITHLDNRLAYERAMLAAAGGTAADKNSPRVGGAVRCWAAPRGGWAWIKKVNRVSVTILDNWGNGGRDFARTIPFDKLQEVMSPEQAEEARAAGRIIPVGEGGFTLQAAQEEPGTPAVEAAPEASGAPDGAFQAMKQTLRDGGVQVVVAPQLFPTPEPLAARMAELANLGPGRLVLEPSAGTGNLVRAIKAQEPEAIVIGVEINPALAGALPATSEGLQGVVTRDFLACTPEGLGTFDAVVMNPPFADAVDIKHILHARKFLKPGGTLVALCADGTRQSHTLQPLADTWEPLPSGTFKTAGTWVNTVLLTMGAEEVA